jgi:hypothetical protein
MSVMIVFRVRDIARLAMWPAVIILLAAVAVIVAMLR